MSHGFHNGFGRPLHVSSGKTPITHNPSPLDATFRYGYPTPASGTTVKDLLHANDTEDTGYFRVSPCSVLCGRLVLQLLLSPLGQQAMFGAWVPSTLLGPCVEKVDGL